MTDILMQVIKMEDTEHAHFDEGGKRVELRVIGGPPVAEEDDIVLMWRDTPVFVGKVTGWEDHTILAEAK